MSEIKTFFLPDLGEGLPDAEIVEWHVAEGDVVHLDAALVSMETAKAVVDVPSPFSGRVVKLYGQAGAVIDTGAALVDMEIDASLPQRKDAESTGHQHAPAAKAAAAPAAVVAAPAAVAAPAPAPLATSGERADQGSVVGAMPSSNEVRHEAASSAGGVKAMPAVRALAKKLGVDLRQIRASAADGVISLHEVKAAAANPPAAVIAAATATSTAAPAPPAAIGKPMRTAPPTVARLGQPEPLRGVRRNMARIMAAAHASVVPTTLCDDADLHAWSAGNDITVRLIRAIVVAAQAVPALNAWFDMENATRTLHARVDVGIAVDTEDGLFVPVLRNADMLDGRGVRAGIERLRAQVMDRSIAADELKGATISLSNFGMFAGRYATPIIVPPTVAIIAAGKGRPQLVPVIGGIESHRLMPLSLTFDHRAATGGEAARFLKALLDDLALAS
ncbi:MAG: branched-chain alpha-keto acid dehydrogenase subunit E2 [Lysobacterales bacterium CG02_land_8_20_14_3_00_62_12]|nr:MAG: branched-chain alpha-keto acid dehydrogenase subunit E2 [Xanthomonadales bacterium CG02_land_8_20_14_3_00_62_12]